MSTSRLTIYLLRDVSTPDEAIDPDKSPNKLALDPGSGLDGAFFYSSRPASQPAWVSFIRPVVSTPFPTLTSSSASGLLVIKASNRFFAFTFGYGRGFINPSKVEHQFGLRVALNRIDPSQIRSLDTKTFEDMVVTNSTQTSKSSDLPAFGVDVSRDILRAVTGEPRDKSLAKRLTGSDALVLNADNKATDLTKLCTELLNASTEQTYKSDFEWIDHLALVNDPIAINQLNDVLIEQLVAGDTSNTHMAMPEPIGWEDIDAFTIGGTRKEEYDDLDLDDYLGRLGAGRTDITLDRLRSRRISIRFGRTSDFDVRWTLYQCLITEQRIGQRLHVLIEGRWFAVSESLVDQVDQFASSLSLATTTLIDAKLGEREADYNARLAGTAPDDLLLLDARIKRPGGASSGIELCDVLTSGGEFVHVKRKSRSSTLSHLFAQGSVAATTFVSDDQFREEIRTVIAAEKNPGNWLDLVPPAGQSVDRSKYSVSYVVIANSMKAGSDWLPFFSKLNLMQSGKQLQNLGFKVSISRVAVTG